MGGVFSSVARWWSSEVRWKAVNRTCMLDLPEAYWSDDCDGLGERPTPDAYFRDCTLALKEAKLGDTPLQWTIPTSVTLERTNSNADTLNRVKSALKACCLELGGRLRCLSLQNHTETNAGAVRALQSKGSNTSVLWSPQLSGLRLNLVTLNLSACRLGDDGVLALITLLFSAASDGKKYAATAFDVSTAQHGTAPSNSANVSDVSALPFTLSSTQPAKSLCTLPSLRTLRLDGVGLTDEGAESMCARLDSIVRCERRAGHSTPSPSTSVVALLPELSVQRNFLSLRGIARVLQASWEPSKDSMRSRIDGGAGSHNAALMPIGVVDVSWNASASLRHDEKVLDSRAAYWAAIGEAMVPSSVLTSSPSHGLRIQALFLRGCDMHEDDMQALWVKGVLATYLDRFREAGKAELLRSFDSFHVALDTSAPLRRHMAFAHVTRIDLSQNAALGTSGVLHLLQTLTALEAARKATTSSRHPCGLVPHPLSALEELCLRDVGCCDAVLPEVVRLLLGDDARASAVERRADAKSPQHRRRYQGLLSKDSVASVLQREAKGLAHLEAQEGHQANAYRLSGKVGVLAETPASSLWCASLLPLPRLRVLDLSSNHFASTDLIATVMASAMLRPSTLPAVPKGVLAQESGASTVGEGMGKTSSASENNNGSAVQFVLSLESCRLSDAALDALPRAFADSKHALDGKHLAVSVRGATTASTLPLPFAVCILLLGHNALTHDAIVRLRRWTQQEHKSAAAIATSVLSGPMLCTVDAYVEGNAVVHPVLSTTRTEEGDGEDSSTTVGAPSLGLTVDAAPHSTSLFSTSPSLALRDGTARVHWGILTSLPTSTLVLPQNRQHHHHVSPYPRQTRSPWARQEHSCTSQTTTHRSSSPTVAYKLKKERRTAHALDFAEPAEAERSPSYSVDPVGYIDEFIAEAERVMTERAYFVRSTADGSVTADVLLQHASVDDDTRRAKKANAECEIAVELNREATKEAPVLLR